MDIAIVPTWNRSEMLWHCLDRLRQTPEVKDRAVGILVSVDRHRSRRDDPDIAKVLREFAPSMIIHDRYNGPHTYTGGTSNILFAYRLAFEMPEVEFVFSVEEDIMVGEDFFRWHYAVQKQGDWMCSIAAKNRRAHQADSNDPAEYFTSRDTYQGWGVCWRANKLLPVLDHAKPEYYADMTGYLARRFPDSVFGNSFTEQDGMIERVLRETHGITAWPYVPRAFQAGAWGLHSWTRPLNGNLESRIQQLADLMYKYPEKLAAMAGERRDVEPCYLGPFPPDEPRLRETL